MNADKLTGILAPVVTPFDQSLMPDKGRYVAHCKWLLRAGCDALAVFGTNSEANSLSVEERMELLEALVAAGVEPGRLVPGTGCCAFVDSLKLSRHAVSLGCAGVLLLPPFYYKGVSDEGLFRSVSEVIERCADRRLRIYLYHIPPVAHVGYSVDLIGRLVKRYPDTVAGIKDSGGDWDHTKKLIEAFPDLSIFSGSEVHLALNLRHGGAGCITATANVRPGPIRELFGSWKEPDTDARQKAINATRATVQAFPMIPALKAIIGHFSRDREWQRVRPPLVELSDDETDALIGRLGDDFKMPGLGA